MLEMSGVPAYMCSSFLRSPPVSSVTRLWGRDGDDGELTARHDCDERANGQRQPPPSGARRHRRPTATTPRDRSGPDIPAGNCTPPRDSIQAPNASERGAVGGRQQRLVSRHARFTRALRRSVACRLCEGIGRPRLGSDEIVSNYCCARSLAISNCQAPGLLHMDG